MTSSINLTKKFIKGMDAFELQALSTAIRLNRWQRVEIEQELFGRIDYPEIIVCDPDADTHGNFIFRMGDVSIWNNRPYLSDALVECLQVKWFRNRLDHALMRKGWSIELDMYHLPTITRALKKLQR